MKLIPICILFYFSIFISSANELFKFELSENQKLEYTYSASLANNTTLHLVIIKNSKLKKHEISSFYVSAEKQVKQLETFAMDDRPKIISYHMAGEEITLVTFNEKAKQLILIDFDITSGKHKINTIDDQLSPDNIFRLDTKTILVYTAKNKLQTYEINNTEKKSGKTITLSPEEEKKFHKILQQSPQEINQNEYVKHGSIKDVKVYLTENENIVFTNESKNKTIEMMLFDLQTKTVESSEVDFSDPVTKYRDFNSYVQDDNLLVLLNDKEDVVLKKYNFVNKSSSEKLSIRNNLAQIKIEGAHFEEFLKQAARLKMKPTITLNKNKDTNFVVRLDYVDKTTYQYYHNWHLHFMMFHMMHMQHINHNISIGPNPSSYDDIFFTYGSPIKNESKSIEFVLDINTNFILENASKETLFSALDKEEYLEKFKDDKSISEITTSFTESELRYIYQDKKSKFIYIKYNKLE